MVTMSSTASSRAPRGNAASSTTAASTRLRTTIQRLMRRATTDAEATAVDARAPAGEVYADRNRVQREQRRREHGSSLPQRRKQQRYAGGDLQRSHRGGDGRDQRIGDQTIVAERGTEAPPVGQLVPGGCAEQQRGAEGDD